MFGFKKTSRRLTRPNLEPEQLAKTGGYLPVPNKLIHFARFGLKPAHFSVLCYLLATPPQVEAGQWKVNYKHMSDCIGVGETYAAKHVTFLRQKGFLTIERNAKGETDWCVNLPEQFTLPDESSDVEPHRENIHVENRHVENVDALVKNKVLEMNKKTTNPVVVSSAEIVKNEIVVALPAEINKPVVIAKLVELTPAQQVLTLSVFVSYIQSLKAKGESYDVIAVIIGCAKKAKAGLLSAPVIVDKTGVKPVDKQIDRVALREFMQKHRDKLREDFRTKSVVKSATFGDITYEMLRDFDLGKL